MADENNMTFAQAFGGSRDMCCIAAVGDMAEMGRFDEEFRMYGCACLEDGKITYRVSPVAEQIYNFVADSAYEGLCPTAIHSHFETMPVPVGMRERLERGVKLNLARQLQAMYAPLFFDSLAPFAQVPAQNEGFDLLDALREQIDGHFDELECQLLEGTMQLVVEAKQVDAVHVVELKQWLEKTRQQMEDTPVIQRGIMRTFYGFCALTPSGTVKTIVNAQALPVWEQQAAMKRSGTLVGPVLQRTQWFDDAMAISDGRSAFRRMLQQLEDKVYFERLENLRALPPVVDADTFRGCLGRLETEASAQAVEDFRGYGYRWHCL